MSVVDAIRPAVLFLVSVGFSPFGTDTCHSLKVWKVRRLCEN